MLNLYLLFRNNEKFEFFKNSKKKSSKNNTYYLFNLEVLRLKDFNLEEIKNESLLAKNINLDVLKFLKLQGLKIKDINPKIFITSATEGNLDVLKFLKSEGFEFKDMENVYFTSFRRSAKKGHLHVLKFLKEEGVEIIKLKNYCCEAFISSVLKGNINILNFLKDEGYDNSFMKKFIFIKLSKKCNIETCNWLKKENFI